MRAPNNTFFIPCSVKKYSLQIKVIIFNLYCPSKIFHTNECFLWSHVIESTLHCSALLSLWCIYIVRQKIPQGFDAIFTLLSTRYIMAPFVAWVKWTISKTSPHTEPTYPILDNKNTFPPTPVQETAKHPITGPFFSVSLVGGHSSSTWKSSWNGTCGQQRI